MSVIAYMRSDITLAWLTASRPACPDALTGACPAPGLFGAAGAGGTGCGKQAREDQASPRRSLGPPGP